MSKRIEILGVPVDCVDMQGALTVVEQLIQGDQARSVIAVNPEKIIACRNNARLLDQISDSGLLIPDGIGVVMACRLFRLGDMQRVPGSELMPEICRMSADRGHRVFLYGARADVIEKAVLELQKRYPGLAVAGYQDGYLPEERMSELVDCINRSGATILFLALGSPRQEEWMSRYLPELTTVKVCQGVGGTFDVIAGEVKRAPASFRRLHLEWFYRLMAQPSRIFRQRTLVEFVMRVLKQKIFGPPYRT